METIPLFKQHPLLGEKIPYISLCELPTPVEKLEKFGDELDISRLYIKRDDLSGRLYGGNKPRKLEFILGDALKSGIKEVITFGAAGSNHALATAIYSGQVGIRSISMLMSQPNAKYVQKNLLLSYHAGAELHRCGRELESAVNMPMVYMSTFYQLLRHRLKRGGFPLLIPPGGSSATGVTGFVNAAFELKEQVVNNLIPEPDYIYIACGTMGTAAGLILGLKAAGMNTRVAAVRVTGEKFTNTKKMLDLIHQVNNMLNSKDASFPLFHFSSGDIDIRNDYFGKQYALFTDEGMTAVSRMQKIEGINLDGTYTGKTLAALISDAEGGKLKEKTVLFWNTLNSRDLSALISEIDYHDLLECFHGYFTEEVQPLDIQ